MPFAFALLKGDAALSDCPCLTEQEKAGMASLIKKADWREDLIAGLKEEIRKIRFDEVFESLGAGLSDGRLIIRCFGKEVTVCPDGEIESPCNLTPWTRMLVLFYIKNGRQQNLSGKWVLHNELKGGMMKFKAFKRECEDPLRQLFDSRFAEMSRILDSYGAEHAEGFATRNAWILHVFPMLPVLFLYWPEEEEFDSKVTVRFDSSADSLFDVEQLIFVMEEVINGLETSLGH